MSTLTPNLGLILEDGITRASRQNLLKLDRLAGGFTVDTDGSLVLSPTSGTAVDIGTSDVKAGVVSFHANTIDFSDVTTISGLSVSYTDLDFTNSSLTSIEDYDTVISDNLDVSTAAAHAGLTSGNPHAVTAADVDTYTASEIDALFAGAASGYTKTSYTVTSLDISNGYLELSEIPSVPATSFVVVQGGPGQAYGIDYNISGSNLNFLALEGLESGDIIEVFTK